MIILDDPTGRILIEFSDDLTVTLRTPKYGAMKRMRAERERLGSIAHDAVRALPEIPEPGETEGVDDAATRARLGRERVTALEQINLDSAEAFWRFVMIGDDTFAGLADPPPPDDVDEWPAEMLYDHHQIGELSLIDRVFGHWGKARFRSGQ